MDYSRYLADHQDRYVSELQEFLRIPSISALPECAPHVRQAAEWVAARLTQAGLEHVAVMETGGHPVVYGDWLHAPERPTILIYGHLDVQPTDPLELWTSPPFEPSIRDGCIYARGASDSKGNMFAPIAALEAMLRTEGTLPVNVKACFEGQEEIGSPQIDAFLAREKATFRADLVLSSDGGQWSEDVPALTVALRGVCGVEITVTGPARDLHSGSFGGAVRNPIHALVALLAGLHDADGRVTIPGFYDDARPLSAQDRQDTARVPFDEAAYKSDLGVRELYGETGYSTRERTWHRPTLEVNGIGGGFQQEGIKTVLPSQARAKITCRLVPNQTSAGIRARLTEHVLAQAPAGVQVDVQPLTMNGNPYVIPKEHPGQQAASAVLQELYGRPPLSRRTGGSIPICEVFQSRLGIHTVNFGFGLADENAHSPNEYFRLSSFRRSQIAYRKLLHRLATYADA